MIGIHRLPPPAPIAVAGGAGVVGARQLQAHAAPLQHDEGARHGAAGAVGDFGCIHGAEMNRRHQGIGIAEEVLWRRIHQGQASRRRDQPPKRQREGQEQCQELGHGKGAGLIRMAQ